MDIGGKDRARLYAADTANRGGVNVEGFHGENSQQQHHHHSQLPAEAFYRVFQYPPQHQQFVQPMTVFNNEGFGPPPPGLSQPPPGFYYPPPQQANLFYASASSPSGQNQHPTVMPVHHPQHQQVYGQFQFQPASAPNIAAECPLRPSPELLLDRGDAQMNVIENGLPSVKKQPVIDPMIENIVGSMSMSTNGTYTPFGPSVSIASTVVGGNHLGGFSQHPLNTNEISENQVRSGPLLSTVVAGSVGSRDKIGIVKPRVIGKEALGSEKVVQRAATPKEGTDSRPQTPGKLSYSEVLTKNEPKGSVSSTKVSVSNSPSPLLGCRTAEGTPGGSRRISVTSLQHSDSKDAFHSNSSSSSSSPVTKPKLPSNSSSFETVTSKGCRNKENNNNNNSSSSSSSNSSKSSQRNTPSATPTHSVGTPVAGQKSGKSDRKVLNISNSQAGGGLGKNKTAGAAGKPAKNFPFEFDIEDLDEFHEERLGSDGKSSVTKRDSLSGGSSVSSSSKNATSAGSCHNSNNVGVEKKTGSLQNGKGRVGREKAERQRSRKGGRDGCIVRRVQLLTAVWALHLISALNWLYRLVLDVGTLSCSLAFTLLEDGYNWWKANAFPSCCQHLRGYMTKIFYLWTRLKSWKLGYFWRRGKGDGAEGDEKSSDGKFGAGGAGMRGGGKNGLSDILSMMGPDRNITLPVNGDEALKRLMSVKGQDPYSILGIRSDSSDETIRRYYKRQAVLVHPDKNIVPGAEEAFKILARAFELIGEPAKRIEYHRQLLEAHQKEVVFGEIGNLLEQLRKKIESVSNSIRCTKCNSRHKKNKTDRPLFAARYCAQCRINHAAREGDLWAERKGLFGWSRSYYACMESSIWEVNEWASCQKKNLKHLLPDCHNVMYRLVAGGAGGGGGNGTTSSANGPGSTTNNASSNNSSSNSTCGNCCNPGQAGHNNKSGKVPSNSSSHSNNGWDEFGGTSRGEESAEPGMDDWDTLISNLVRNPSGPGTSHHHHHKNTHVNSSSSSTSSFSGSKFSGLGSGATATPGSGGGVGGGCPSANVNPSRRRGKVKRK